VPITEEEIRRRQEKRRRQKECWGALPPELWAHAVEAVDDQSALWRLTLVSRETRRLGLGLLHEKTLAKQASSAKLLDQAGPYRPLESRIEQRQGEILTVLEELAGCISREGYLQMRSYGSGQPCAAIERIVEIACHVVNKTPLDLDPQRRVAWLFVPAKLEIMRNWVSLGDYQPTGAVRQALEGFVLRPELTPEAVERVSPAAAEYARWIHGVHDYWELLRELALTEHSRCSMAGRRYLVINDN